MNKTSLLATLALALTLALRPAPAAGKAVSLAGEHDRGAGSDRSRFAAHCLGGFAPAELGLPSEPASEFRDFCARMRSSPSSPAIGRLLAAAREPEPSAAEQWAAIEAEEDVESDRPAVANSLLEEAASMPGVKDKDKLWPGARVLYCLDSGLADTSEVRFNWARMHIESKTCVRFVPVASCAAAVSDKSDFVRVTTVPNKCSSTDAGLKGGEQAIKLGTQNGCGAGSAVHELCHVLGFKHMHASPDRDKYIKVHDDRIKAAKLRQYEKLSSWKWKQYGQFGFDSIMMYSASSSNRKEGATGPLIEERSPMGTPAPTGLPWDGKRQRLSLSASDATTLSAVYCGGGAHRPGTKGVEGHEGHETGETSGTAAAEPADLEAWFRGVAGKASWDAAEVKVLLKGGDKVFETRCKSGGSPVYYRRRTFATSSGATADAAAAGTARLWAWSSDNAAGTWNNVPSLVQSNGRRDGRLPELCHVKIIEALSVADGRPPPPFSVKSHWEPLFKRLVPGVKELQLHAAKSPSVWGVECESSSGGCSKTRFYQQAKNGFWWWATKLDGSYSRVADSWKGKACECHNALNAALLAQPATARAVSGALLHDAKSCLWHDDKSHHYRAGFGACERTTVFQCGKDESCKHKGGCQGRCVCARKGINSCRCLRPLDLNTESCGSAEKA